MASNCLQMYHPVTDGGTDEQIESDAYELTEHEHRCAQKRDATGFIQNIRVFYRILIKRNHRKEVESGETQKLSQNVHVHCTKFHFITPKDPQRGDDA